MYLLDTNICIYFLKGQFEISKKAESAGMKKTGIIFPSTEMQTSKSRKTDQGL